MVNILCAMASCVVSIAPGPRDASLANFHSLRCKVEFVAEFHQGSDPDFLERLHQFRPGPGPARKPEYVVEGRWEYDGAVEHHVIRVVGGTKFQPESRKGPVQTCEVLWEKNELFYHLLRPGEFTLHTSRTGERAPFPLIGPFVCGKSTPFEREFQAFSSFARLSVDREFKTQGGHLAEMEVYEKNQNGSVLRREIAYDPAVGFLPRFSRAIAHNYSTKNEEENASVVDYYLIDAVPVTSGGVVPSEWYSIHQNIRDFKRRYGEYSDAMTIEFSPTDCDLIHFKALSVNSLESVVKLDQMDGVLVINGAGGSFRKVDGLGQLSMADIRNRLGARLIPINRPSLPNIDVAEQKRFEPKPARTRWEYPVVGLVALVASVFSYRSWRR